MIPGFTHMRRKATLADLLVLGFVAFCVGEHSVRGVSEICHALLYSTVEQVCLGGEGRKWKRRKSSGTQVRKKKTITKKGVSVWGVLEYREHLGCDVYDIGTRIGNGIGMRTQDILSTHS